MYILSIGETASPMPATASASLVISSRIVILIYCYIRYIRVSFIVLSLHSYFVRFKNDMGVSNIYIYIYMLKQYYISNIYIYIYIYREREREREIIYIYIYIFA